MEVKYAKLTLQKTSFTFFTKRVQIYFKILFSIIPISRRKESYFCIEDVYQFHMVFFLCQGEVPRISPDNQTTSNHGSGLYLLIKKQYLRIMSYELYSEAAYV